MGRGERRAPVLDSGRLRPVAVAEEGRHPGLVVRHPVIDEVAQMLEDELGVDLEAVGDLARGPAAFVLQRLGEVPVVEGRKRCDPALEQALAESAVEVDPLLIRRPAPVRLDPRPRDREAVALEPERAHHVKVLAPAVVVLAGAVAGVAVRDPAGSVREAVPDRLAAAVSLRGTLDLVCGGCRTPHEFVGKAHPLTAPFMLPPIIWRPRTRNTIKSGRMDTKVPVRTRA